MFPKPVCTSWLVVALALAGTWFGCSGGGGGGSVGPPTQAPVIASFSASPASVLVGGSTTLTWSVAGAASLAIAPGVGTVTGTSAAVTPAGPVTYTLTASNAAGTATATAAVSVGVPAAGGAVVSGPARIVVAAGAAAGRLDFQVTPVDPPPGLPAGIRTVGQAVDIALPPDQAAGLNEPVRVTLQYDPAGVADPGKLTVAHYDPGSRTWGPVTLLATDPANHTLTFSTRVFSPFAIIDLFAYALPSSYFVPGFDPQANGWDVANFGSYFAPGGNCMGMSAYAVWFFRDHPGERLYGFFPRSADGWPYVAYLTIQRAHLAQSQFWGKVTGVLGSAAWQAIAPEGLAFLMKGDLAAFNQPMVMTFLSAFGRHAGVLYGYDSERFYFYDTNYPGESRSVTWNGTIFGVYDGWYGFGYVAAPDLGRGEDFETLTEEAEEGFPGSSQLVVTSPQPGAAIAAHEATLSGTVTQAGATDLIAYVQGMPVHVPLQGGQFNATIPVCSGSNTIALLAGTDVIACSNWYPHALCRIFSVTGSLSPSPFMATLTWDQGGADVDLYVTDPANNTAWYHSPATSTGLTLDFDNTSGYGPEHITLASGSTPLPGTYSVDVHYYRGTVPATGRVAVLLNEGQSNANLRILPFTLATANSANRVPGASGPDWAHIATVDLVNNEIEWEE